MKKTRIATVALISILLLFSCTTLEEPSLSNIDQKEISITPITEEKEELPPVAETTEEAKAVEETIVEEVEEEPIEIAEEHPIEDKKEDSFPPVDPSDIVSLFNYAYGLKTMDDLKSEGISMTGLYFARGVYDAVLSKAPSLIRANEIQSYIDAYVAEYYSKGKSFTPGERPEGMEEISSLTTPENTPDTFSYAYTFSLVRDLIDGEVEIVSSPFIQGGLDSLFDSERLLDEAEENNAINAYIAYLNEAYLKALEEKEKANEDRATSFMEENGKLSYVETLDNGLQMMILDQDETIGEMPTQYSTVLVDYNIYVMDYDTEDLYIIDADYWAELRLIEIDTALMEAITSLHTGEAARFWVSPEKLYGNRNIEGIEPNSIVVFDIALHEIIQ